MVSIQLLLRMKHGRELIGIIGTKTDRHDALALFVVRQERQPFAGRFFYPGEQRRTLEVGIAEIEQVGFRQRHRLVKADEEIGLAGKMPVYRPARDPGRGRHLVQRAVGNALLEEHPLGSGKDRLTRLFCLGLGTAHSVISFHCRHGASEPCLSSMPWRHHMTVSRLSLDVIPPVKRRQQQSRSPSSDPRKSS